MGEFMHQKRCCHYSRESSHHHPSPFKQETAKKIPIQPNREPYAYDKRRCNPYVFDLFLAKVDAVFAFEGLLAENVAVIVRVV